MSTKDETELDLDLPEDDGDGEDEVTEPTPEELKASVANLEKALKKANREAAKLRAEKKTEDDKPKEDEKPATSDKYKLAAVASAARAELKDAGFSGTKEQAAKLSRLLDLDELDVDDDGEVDGLEDAVADLKEQFPALFAVSSAEEKPKTPRISTAPKNQGPGSIATSVDPVAEARYNRLFGGGSRKR